MEKYTKLLEVGNVFLMKLGGTYHNQLAIFRDEIPTKSYKGLFLVLDNEDYWDNPKDTFVRWIMNKYMIYVGTEKNYNKKIINILYSGVK